jgi:hypothetical protein
MRRNLVVGLVLGALVVAVASAISARQSEHAELPQGVASIFLREDHLGLLGSTGYRRPRSVVQRRNRGV